MTLYNRATGLESCFRARTQNTSGDCCLCLLGRDPDGLTPICVHLRLNSSLCAFAGDFCLRFLCLFAVVLLFLFVSLCLCVRFYSRIFVACRAVGFAKADPFAVAIHVAHLSFVICSGSCRIIREAPRCPKYFDKIPPLLPRRDQVKQSLSPL